MIESRLVNTWPIRRARVIALAVGSMPCDVLTRMGSPNRIRSRASALLMPDWVMFIRSAARVTRHSSTSTSKQVNRCGSIFLAFGRSEEHTTELQSLMRISYAAFCLEEEITPKAQTDRKASALNTEHAS